MPANDPTNLDLTGAALGVEVPLPSISSVLGSIAASAQLALAVAARPTLPGSDRFLAHGACRELVLLHNQLQTAWVEHHAGEGADDD